jgi:hypothetical protein
MGIVFEPDARVKSNCQDGYDQQAQGPSTIQIERIERVIVIDEKQ